MARMWLTPVSSASAAADGDAHERAALLWVDQLLKALASIPAFKTTVLLYIVTSFANGEASSMSLRPGGSEVFADSAPVGLGAPSLTSAFISVLGSRGLE